MQQKIPTKGAIEDIMFVEYRYDNTEVLAQTVERYKDTGRVERGSFTLTLSQNRA